MFKKNSKKDLKVKRETKDSKKEIEELKKKVEENLAGWKRALADYENFKKREEENKKELICFSNLNLILEILPILDNFQHAYNSLPKELEKNNWVLGIKYIKDQLENLLKSIGVEEIKAVGEKFDPRLHEAVGKIKTKDEKDIVVEEVLKGYKLNGKAIRAVKVKING